jgi:hypothetical protein
MGRVKTKNENREQYYKESAMHFFLIYIYIIYLYMRSYTI